MGMSTQPESAPDRLKHNRKKQSCISELAFVLVVLGILVAIIYPVIQHARDTARYSDNPHNADIIGRALLLYYEGSDGCLPPTERWGTVLQPFVNRVMEKDALDRSMRDGNKEAAYRIRQFNIVRWDREPFAMNRALSGVNVKKIKHPEQTVVFFETTERIPNLSGDQSLQMSPYGGRKRNAVVMADGTMLIIGQAQGGSGRLVDWYGKPVTIRWKP